MRHVINMTAAGSVGLVAVFAVDLLNLFYISRLGHQELAAAVGYAGTLLFFITSLSIGLSIAATALTSRALGRGDREQAKSLAGFSLVFMAGLLLTLSLAAFPFLGGLVRMLGASGETATLATEFMQIVLPSSPLLAIGMCASALLRALGDAKRSMYVTLGAGAATAVLDPIFIFALGMGVHGAAVANVLARLVLLGIGAHALLRVHKLFAWPTKTVFVSALKPFMAIGIPAVLTQIATPVSNTFVTRAFAAFGDDAVAAWAVIGRITPVAFAVIFALSGSIGAIIGQNFGAKRFDRVKETMVDSLKVTVIYVIVMWALLAIFAGLIADIFGVKGQARALIIFFNQIVSASFLFNGALFVANAAFNNLGYAFYSTALNWGRATLGVIPFVYFGAQINGAVGVLAGYGLGVVIFWCSGAADMFSGHQSAEMTVYEGFSPN